MSAAAQAPAAPGGGRHLFIDLFRTLIILLMLEGHVLREFLPAEIQSTFAFWLHEIAHGITAPAFLFGAGLTFVISSHRRWSEFHRWSPDLERRLRRIVMIFLIGIFLHLPYFSFRKTLMEAGPRQILELFQSDVLTCIAAGLLILHAVLFFFKTEGRFHTAVVVLMAGVVLLTPIVWDIDFLHFTPAFLAQLSNNLHGSPFPLFPFLGYLFAGVAVSGRFIEASTAGEIPRFMGRLAAAGGAVLVLGLALAAIPWTPYPTYDFWYTSPSYFLIRLGILLAVTPLFWKAAAFIGPRVRPLLVLGTESLFVYVLHLLVLYGSVVNARLNLGGLIAGPLDLPEATAVFLGLTLAMFLGALGWRALKDRSPRSYRLVQGAVGMAVLYLFFTRDY